MPAACSATSKGRKTPNKPNSPTKIHLQFLSGRATPCTHNAGRKTRCSFRRSIPDVSPSPIKLATRNVQFLLGWLMEMINRNRTNPGLMCGFRNLGSCSAEFPLRELRDCGRRGKLERRLLPEVAHLSEIGLINNLGCDSDLFNHTRKAERNHLGAGLCSPRACTDLPEGRPSPVWRWR